MIKRGRGKAGDRAAQELTDDPAETTPDPFRAGAEAAELSGVPGSSSGDCSVFVTGLVTNIVMMATFFIAFSVLRRRYPLVYAGNVVARNVPFEPSGSFLGWLYASLQLSIDDVVEHAGLDQAMMLEFAHLAMSLLMTLMVPLLFVMSPIHWVFGGDRSGDDQLSRLGLANVVDGHPWLYWVHAVLVWFVVVTVQRAMYGSMGKFLVRRKAWLRAMPSPRATSILVQNFPDDMATDERLAAYFNSVFDSDVVEAVHIVRHTAKLLELVNAKASADLSLEEAQFKENHTGTRPTLMDYTGATHDSITYYTEKRKEAAQAIAKERKRVQDAAREGDPNIYTRNAFVTFKQRRDSELALKVTYKTNTGQFVCELPPDPSDVIYTDLQRDHMKETFMWVIGYCALAGVFWAFLPAVLGALYIGKIDNLAKHFGFFQKMSEDPDSSSVWNAMVGCLALQLFTSLVPTIFAWIFSSCFASKAQAWLQHRIQIWYFWFLVTYVMLVTALGSSIIRTTGKLVDSPDYIFYTLASTMPYATYFYLNYVPLQWVTNAQNCLRIVQLGKFMTYTNIYEEDQAKHLSEPEDQDYYGIGGRSARQSFILVLTLVFCSLTPLILLLGFINFFVCRLVFGYLTVFAELRKPDLGGAFWVTSLHNVQRCMPIYICLMSGVLCFRDDTCGPCIIAGSSLGLWYLSYSRFGATFRWESLSLEDLGKDGPCDERRQSSVVTYQQPELIESAPSPAGRPSQPFFWS